MMSAEEIRRATREEKEAWERSKLCIVGQALGLSPWEDEKRAAATLAAKGTVKP